MTGGAVITAVNGTPVTSPDDLTAILGRFRTGTTITVTWDSPSAAGHQQPAPDRRSAPVTTR